LPLSSGTRQRLGIEPARLLRPLVPPATRKTSLINTATMANQNPSTPVKVPSSAANHTAATLDPDLRSQINSILIKEGHVTK
jgi:hypothetical protein